MGHYFAFIGYLLPETFAWVPPRTSLLLGIIMFGMGTTLKAEDFKRVLSQPKGNVPISVSMTSISTILAPILTSFVALVLAGQWLHVSAGDMFVDIATSGAAIFVVVFLHNILGLLIGYLIGKFLNLYESSSRAISMEVGMQNSGLATNLAMAYFSPVAALLGAIFSVWYNISGPLLATYWQKDQ